MAQVRLLRPGQKGNKPKASFMHKLKQKAFWPMLVLNIACITYIVLTNI